MTTLSLLACGVVALSGCATDERTTAYSTTSTELATPQKPVTTTVTTTVTTMTHLPTADTPGYSTTTTTKAANGSVAVTVQDPQNATTRIVKPGHPVAPIAPMTSRAVASPGFSGLTGADDASLEKNF